METEKKRIFTIQSEQMNLERLFKAQQDHDKFKKPVTFASVDTRHGKTYVTLPSRVKRVDMLRNCCKSCAAFGICSGPREGNEVTISNVEKFRRIEKKCNL